MKALNESVQVLAVAGIFLVVTQFCMSIGLMAMALLAGFACFSFVTLAVYVFFQNLEEAGICGRPHGDY